MLQAVKVFIDFSLVAVEENDEKNGSKLVIFGAKKCDFV